MTTSETLGSSIPGRMDDSRREARRSAERLSTLADPTPAEFLTETLPAFARRQRLGRMLTEVRAAESLTLAELSDVIALLNRAIGLRERLERALEGAGGPLSAIESAERPSGVPQDTLEGLGPDLGVFRNPEVYAYPLSEVIKDASRSGALHSVLSKPGPY